MGNLINRISLCYNGSNELQELITQIKSNNTSLQTINSLLDDAMKYTQCNGLTDLINASSNAYIEVVNDKCNKLLLTTRDKYRNDTLNEHCQEVDSDMKSIRDLIEGINDELNKYHMDLTTITTLTDSFESCKKFVNNIVGRRVLKPQTDTVMSISKRLLEKYTNSVVNESSIWSTDKKSITDSLEICKKTVNKYSLDESVIKTVNTTVDETIGAIDTNIRRRALNKLLYDSVKMFGLIVCSKDCNNTDREDSMLIDSSNPVIRILSESLNEDSYDVLIGFPALQRILYFYDGLTDKNMKIIRGRLLNLTAYINNIVLDSNKKSQFINDIKFNEIFNESLIINGKMTLEDFYKNGNQVLINIFNKKYWYLDALPAMSNTKMIIQDQEKYPFNYPIFDDTNMAFLTCVNAIIANINGRDTSMSTYKDDYFKVDHNRQYPYSKEIYYKGKSKVVSYETLLQSRKSLVNESVNVFTLPTTDNRLILDVVGSMLSMKLDYTNNHKLPVVKDSSIISPNVGLRFSLQASTMNRNELHLEDNVISTSINPLMSFVDILVKKDLMHRIYNKFIVASLEWDMCLPYCSSNDDLTIVTNDLLHDCKKHQLIQFNVIN